MLSSISEKEAVMASDPVELKPLATHGGKDNALMFLEQHQDERIEADPATLKRLRRKVDYMVIPFLMFCYALNFIDKVLLNYAAVMGLNQSLQLKGDEFSKASSSFFIAVLIAALLNTYPLQKCPTGKWLGLSLILWGISTACHAAVKNFVGLVVVRVLSGIFEAGLPPALMLLSAQYYTRQEQTSRFSLWFLGMGLGQILGGLISFAFQHVPPSSALAGWKVMFVVLGLITMLFGVSVCAFVPDTPMAARFFTDQEKVMILEHTKVNQVGVVNRKWRTKEIFEACLDVQFWLMFGAILLVSTGGGTITSYSAQLLRSFGFTPKQAALLNMPSGVINMCSSLVTGFGPRRYGNRWFFSVLVMAVGVMGASMMSFIDASNRGGLLAGLYLANFFIGVTPLNFQWITGNTAGHTKRAFTTTAMNAAFAIGNIIGPETFKAKDAPMYKPAKISLVATWSSSAGCLLLLVAYYHFANQRRVMATKEDAEVANDVAYAGMTDMENPHFRYSY
ncbi:major facilitator superfamily domain-containing protein [Elsinoe ampelina]|uniref:Major facilitator superfamily domain-containing protein n=1 Tax=Elsinoe ampelina TaxID=302913 RepID=A0A6A6GQQ0_9PEZI|nr:major facilitator superfamily domain-containing protein [Elsinoe ampelina]